MRASPSVTLKRRGLAHPPVFGCTVVPAWTEFTMDGNLHKAKIRRATEPFEIREAQRSGGVQPDGLAF
jgi:hypothetical protein